MEDEGRDFVVRRKRKRYAVDPCLGFYASPEPPVKAELIPSAPPISPALRPKAEEPIPSPTMEQQVSVHDFLTTTAAKTWAKQYRSKRRARDMEYASSLEKAQCRVPKKSVGQRLLQAAVATGVEPFDSFMQDMVDVSTTRRPLQFQVATDDGYKSNNCRQWSLVDPKKSTPFPRGASFAPKTKRPDADGPVRVKLRQPLTQWYTINHRSPTKKPPACKSHVKLLQCPPLSFIPLHVAEESYSRNKGQLQSRPTRLHPEAGRDSLTFVEEPLPPQKSLSLQPASDMRYLNETQQIDPEAHLPKILSFHDPQADIRDLRSSSSISSQPLTSDNASTSNKYPARSIATDHSAQTMRPLASFLESFLGTARAATQMQESQNLSRPSTLARGARPRPRPRTAALTQQHLTFDSATPDNSLAYANGSFVHDDFSHELDLEGGDVDFVDEAPVTKNLADVLSLSQYQVVLK